jgi:hypothetical protein
LYPLPFLGRQSRGFAEPGDVGKEVGLTPPPIATRYHFAQQQRTIVATTILSFQDIRLEGIKQAIDNQKKIRDCRRFLEVGVDKKTKRCDPNG